MSAEQTSEQAEHTPEHAEHRTPGQKITSEHSLEPAAASGLPSPRATIDGERLIAVFSELVEPLGRAFPVSSEVVLHDLSKLPDSIVAIHGDITGRQIGGPATDLLLELATVDNPAHQFTTETQLPDGRRIQSSSMIIRDVSGYPVAALCINTDISAWAEVKRIAEAMLDAGPSAPSAPDDSESAWDFTPAPPSRPAEAAAKSSRESFPKDVDELATHLIREAINDVGIDPLAMKKEHKIRVIETLQSKGFFMLKDAIEMIATRFDVTRFTIYNYLNEVSDSGRAEKKDPEQPEKSGPAEKKDA